MKNLLLVIAVFAYFNVQGQNCVGVFSLNLNTIVQAPVERYNLTWNTNPLGLSCSNFVSRIEFFSDGQTNPNNDQNYDYACGGDPNNPYVMEPFHIDIDIFNQGNYFLTMSSLGLTKCVWWRIVIEGSGCPTSTGSCHSESAWVFAHPNG